MACAMVTAAGTPYSRWLAIAPWATALDEGLLRLRGGQSTASRPAAGAAGARAMRRRSRRPGGRCALGRQPGDRRRAALGRLQRRDQPETPYPARPARRPRPVCADGQRVRWPWACSRPGMVLPVIRRTSRRPRSRPCAPLPGLPAPRGSPPAACARGPRGTPGIARLPGSARDGGAPRLAAVVDLRVTARRLAVALDRRPAVVDEPHHALRAQRSRVLVRVHREVRERIAADRVQDAPGVLG